MQRDIAFAHSICVRDSNIDRAFKRYRQTGDPALMARVFDAAAGELMQLGWHLTGDRHLAEDLVQATFLVAMEDAEAFIDERRIMPWLCGILANRARQLRRQPRGRARHTIESRTDVVDPVSEAATQELQAEVSQALRGLPQPYREVLLLHLQHGLSGAEIADALARPGATVRSQVHRGLDLLRKALPATYAGVALTAVPTDCLAAMRRSLFGPQAVLQSVGSFALILTMKNLSLVALVLCALLPCVWLMWPSVVVPSPSAVPSALPVASSAQALPEGAVLTELADRQPAGANVIGEAGLEVYAVTKHGIPVANVGLTWSPLLPRSSLVQREMHTDAQGRVRFVGLPPGKSIVRCDRGGHVEVELLVGIGGRETITLPGEITVQGIAVDEHDKPIANAEIWLAPQWKAGSLVARSASDGTFLLASVAPESHICAWSEGLSTLQQFVVSAGSADRCKCQLVLHPAGGRVEGVVRDTAGHPISSATVLLDEHSERRRIDIDRGELSNNGSITSRMCRTDADGRFAFVGATRGRLAVRAASPDHAVWRRDIQLGSEGMRLEIQLGAGAIVSGQARDRSGKPAAGVFVNMDGWCSPGTRTDSEGCYSLEHLQVGPCILRAKQDRQLCAIEFDLVEGQQLEWNPQFGVGPSVTGSVVNPDGTPLVDWEVQLHGEAGFSRRTDEQGQFAIDAELGDYKLLVVEPRIGVVAVSRRNLKPTSEPLRIEVPWSRLPSARITGELRDEQGAVVTGDHFEFVHLGGDGSSTSFHKVEQENGRFVSDLLFPGRYRLRATTKAHGQIRSGPFAVARGETLDVGSPRFDRPGKLFVRVVPAGLLQTKRSGFVLLRAESEPEGGGFRLKDDGANCGLLQPGIYYVSTRQPLTAITVRVEVLPGVDSEVALHVAAGVACIVRYPPIPCDDHVLCLTFRDQNDVVVYDSSGRNDANVSGFDMPLRIAAGRYIITVADASGRTSTTTAEVVAKDPPVVISLSLPSNR